MILNSTLFIRICIGAYRPLKSFCLISPLLSKDVMLHVNFTDHMFYPEHGKFFRTISSFLYDSTMRLMGRPKRVLPSKIIEKLSSFGMNKSNSFKITLNMMIFIFQKIKIDEVCDAFGKDILKDRPS